MAATAAILVALGPLRAQPARPMELEDMFRVRRVSDPQISPDGKRVAFVITEVLKDENRTNADRSSAGSRTCSSE